MNSITIMGRLARNPELRHISTQKGDTEVTRFPLVVRRNRTNKAFAVMITAYGANAGFVQKYLEKGMKVTISGELVVSQIKDEKRESVSYYTEIIVDMLEFAESKVRKETGSDGFSSAKRADIPFEIPEEMEREMPFR
ncbi:MAG: single-stranded DNA-binding protein [Clostridiales bacterium]|nr:single-stranded DNA-binding protein [uncultured Blautia sp.]MBS6195149.1 single-stranded DNA-binding protein [Clostridiales bacterium]